MRWSTPAQTANSTSSSPVPGWSLTRCRNGFRVEESVMLRIVLAGLGVSALAAAAVYAQAAAPQQGQPPTGAGATAPGGGRAGGRGGGGGGGYPTQEQWDAMPPRAKEYVEKARTIAGSDPDL